ASRRALVGMRDRTSPATDQPGGNGHGRTRPHRARGQHLLPQGGARREQCAARRPTGPDCRRDRPPGRDLRSGAWDARAAGAVTPLRIAVAQIQHETNVFSSVRTDVPAFRRSGLKFGTEIEAERCTNSAFGGFFAAADRHGIELLPILSVWVTPSGIGAADAITQLVHHLTDQLVSLRPDGIALSLHGAMVSEVDRDGDGWILEQVREAGGWDTSVAAACEFHVNSVSQ